MGRLEPTFFLENSLIKWSDTVMDILGTCARFILIRFKLNKTEAEVVHDLSTLLGVDSHDSRINVLLKRFSNHQDLIEILNAWDKGDSEEIMTRDHVYQLFGKEKLERFSRYYHVPTFHMATAFSELVPVIVKKHLHHTKDQTTQISS